MGYMDFHDFTSVLNWKMLEGIERGLFNLLCDLYPNHPTKSCVSLLCFLFSNFYLLGYTAYFTCTDSSLLLSVLQTSTLNPKLQNSRKIQNREHYP